MVVTGEETIANDIIFAGISWNLSVDDVSMVDLNQHLSLQTRGK
jgi:hypothetical protein